MVPRLCHRMRRGSEPVIAITVALASVVAPNGHRHSSGILPTNAAPQQRHGKRAPASAAAHPQNVEPRNPHRYG